MAIYPLPQELTRFQRRRYSAPSRRRTVKTTLTALLIFVMGTASIAVFAFVVMIARLRPTIPTIAQISSFSPAESTRIYSSDGVLLAKLQIENRKVVQLEDVSQSLIEATLAVEDERFYEHKGIDPHGIMRAVWANLTGGDVFSQGGSTITQQLARNVSQFGISREKSLRRKLREAMTAVRIEQALSKREILELYLNQIYYGSGAYGVEAASRTYFGKSASALTLAESALLAGIPQRPDRHSPYNNAGSARQRRSVVLKRMLETGKISATQHDSALQKPIVLAGIKHSNRVYRAPYFVDWVVKSLERAYGKDGLYSGLTVITTLNWRMQERAEKVLAGRLPYGATQAALVSLDPHTGYVRAMVGGRSYRKDQFNAVVQGLRQPGSAFKPIVYAAAFDTGTVDITTRVRDERLQLVIDKKNTWTVHNYDNAYGNKDRSVLDAVRYSINTIAVNVGLQTGIDQIIRYARALGIHSDLPVWPSLTLGSGAVRPIELCSAYGVFAAGGERYEPVGVVSVTDARGISIYVDNVSSRLHPSVLGQGTIDQINFALREAVQSGSGFQASRIPTACGKTGTTSDHRDAWFVGYTAELVTAVWTAAPARDKKGKIRFRVMHGGTGGKVAAPLWARFMVAAVPIQKKVNARSGKQWSIHIVKYEVEPVKEPQGPPSRSETHLADSSSFIHEANNSGNGANLSTGTAATTISFLASNNGEEASTTSLADSGKLHSVCADSGLTAGEFCPVTVMRRVTTRFNESLPICRRHTAPAGEPQLVMAE